MIVHNRFLSKYYFWMMMDEEIMSQDHYLNFLSHLLSAKEEQIQPLRSRMESERTLRDFQKAIERYKQSRA
jgi:hypothetical protein